MYIVQKGVVFNSEEVEKYLKPVVDRIKKRAKRLIFNEGRPKVTRTSQTNGSLILFLLLSITTIYLRRTSCHTCSLPRRIRWLH